MLVEQVTKRKEDRRSLRERRDAPLAEGTGRGFDGRIHLGRRREVDDTRLLPGGRVEDRPLLAGGTRDCLAADPVADPLQAAIVAFCRVRAGPASRPQRSARSVDTTAAKVHNGAHRFRPRTLGVSHASHGLSLASREHRAARPGRRPCRVRWFEHSRRHVLRRRRTDRPGEHRRRGPGCNQGRRAIADRLRCLVCAERVRRPQFGRSRGLGYRARQGRLRRPRHRLHDQQRHVLGHHPGAARESVQVSDELLELHADASPRGPRASTSSPTTRRVRRGWSRWVARRSPLPPTCAATRWRSNRAPRKSPTRGDTWGCSPGGAKIAGDTDHCTSAGKSGHHRPELRHADPGERGAAFGTRRLRDGRTSLSPTTRSSSRRAS